MQRTSVLCLLIVILFLLSISAASAQIYVDADATGADDGSSWTDAYTNLKSATTVAVYGDEIWVAAGTYVPDDFVNRAQSFAINDGVKVYGGFAGTESSVGERDIEANPTILSGEINAPGIADNSYHVVTVTDADATTLLDGFTITLGNANGTSTNRFGAGIYVLRSSARLTNLTVTGNAGVQGSGIYTGGGTGNPWITNTVIANNTATGWGGGIEVANENFPFNGVPRLIDVTVSGNSAAEGGGIFIYQTDAVLERVTVTENTAMRGGGMMCNTSDTRFTDVIIHDNEASLDGGGAFFYNNSSADLVNVAITANSAARFGGGVFFSGASADLTNVTIAANMAFDEGGGMYNIGLLQHNMTATNTIIAGNTAAVAGDEVVNGPSDTVLFTYSLIQGAGGSGAGWDPAVGTDGGNNVDGDPLFVDAAGGNIKLGCGSPAIDVGDNSAPNLPATDIDGGPRIVDGIVDMGAQEFPGAPVGTMLYVDASAVGTATGASWVDALTSVKEALAMACPNITEIWVAAGTYVATTGVDVTATFQLRNGLALYGGFTGAETMLGERDIAANPTVLTGSNLLQNVVTGSGTNATAVLDGFTVTGGAALGVAPEGGGMLNDGGSPTVANAIFAGNTAVYGGGMANLNGSNPSVSNVTFTANQANEGGGMYNHMSAPSVVNAVFEGNHGDIGGGMANINNSHPIIVNATFGGNTTAWIGGMINAASNPTVFNTIFWGNGSDEIGSFSGSNPVFSYSLIEGSGGSGVGWDSSIGTDGGNNLDADPLFVDLPGGNLRLSGGSPAIDAGDNNAPGLPATDIDGNPRIIGVTVDMGAYEFDPVTAIDDGDVVPKTTAIQSVYPNPFNPTVTVAYELNRARIVDVSIYNVKGQIVRRLVNGVEAAGLHRATWDATDDSGAPVATGIYLIQIQSEGWTDHRKVTLLK